MTEEKIDIVGIITIDFLYFAIDEYRTQGMPALQWKQINNFTLAFLNLSFTESLMKNRV